MSEHICDQPGCGLSYEWHEDIEFRLVTNRVLRCPRDDDAHALCKRVAELEAQLAEVDRAMIEATSWNEPMLRRFLQDGAAGKPYKSALTREAERKSHDETL